jgi:polyphosphate kinase
LGSKVKVILKNREISWLSFNERVLQEAEDPNTPLIERLKFLGIFSSNLDEFFRVRVATNKRLLLLKKKIREEAQFHETKKVLEKIHDKVLSLQERFDTIYKKIRKELKEHDIFIINEEQLTLEQVEDTLAYFKSEVLPKLIPILIGGERPLPELKDRAIYLAIKMQGEQKKKGYALVEIPTEEISRFFVLPKKSNEQSYILLLDDVIRISLHLLFSNLPYDEFEAYTVKITRDAELDIDSDVSLNIMEQMRKSLKQRKKGDPVRFIYDKDIPDDILKIFKQGMSLSKEELIPGQRYHNFKDFIGFPKNGNRELTYQFPKPIPIPELENSRSIMASIKKKDFLLNHPYQSFDYVVRLLREAAIDPDVTTIKITLYRVAKKSNIVKALINAIKNGKKIIVVMELQARFDEESNIYWSNKLQEEGAEVRFGIPNLKIHTKLCIIEREEKGETIRYAHMATGNYNGRTARLYCDSGILTANQKLLKEANKVFSLIQKFEPNKYEFKEIMVSPINMKSEIIRLIENEIEISNSGGKGYVKFKMNSLVDPDVIYWLYNASNAGVKVELIVRGICTLIPGVKNMSENIKIISIVDMYLEHARIYIFGNGGDEKVYMGSADLMTRNLDHRIELCFPILDDDVKSEIQKMIEIQLRDNVKARKIEMLDSNKYVKHTIPAIRSQHEFYNFLKSKYQAGWN